MKKITQQEIAKILNVTQATVSKYKLGYVRLNFNQALLLKEQLNWTDEDIKSFISAENSTTTSNEISNHKKIEKVSL